MRRVFIMLMACLAFFPLAASAGDLTPKAAAQILDHLDGKLNAYVDPAVAAKLRAAVKAKRAAYMKLDSREALAAAVSADLYAVSNDLHLKLRVDTVDGSSPQAALTAEQEAQLEGQLAHGLMAIRRLPGNVGYLKLRYFRDDADAAAMIDTAFALLKDTDALIIDLRENTGGGGASDTRLLGQLSAKPIPMAGIVWRNPDGTSETWQRQVSIPAAGPLYADKPVFVLIGKKTFSAAEEVAYDLKASGRAVLIGERTRGGGNPSRLDGDLGFGMSVFVPNGRVVHPTTGTGWEGVGVEPDIAVDPATALTEAYGRALGLVRPKVVTPRSQKELEAARADPKAALLADQAL